MNNIKNIQSKINAQEARIAQFEVFYLNDNNKKVFNQMKEYLEKLQLELAKEIEVNNPQVI